MKGHRLGKIVIFSGLLLRCLASLKFLFVCLLACLLGIIFLSFFFLLNDVSFTGLDTFVDAVHSCYHPVHHLKTSR